MIFKKISIFFCILSLTGTYLVLSYMFIIKYFDLKLLVLFPYPCCFSKSSFRGFIFHLAKTWFGHQNAGQEESGQMNVWWFTKSEKMTMVVSVSQLSWRNVASPPSAQTPHPHAHPHIHKHTHQPKALAEPIRKS